MTCVKPVNTGMQYVCTIRVTDTDDDSKQNFRLHYVGGRPLVYGQIDSV